MRAGAAPLSRGAIARVATQALAGDAITAADLAELLGVGGDDIDDGLEAAENADDELLLTWLMEEQAGPPSPLSDMAPEQMQLELLAACAAMNSSCPRNRFEKPSGAPRQSPASMPSTYVRIDVGETAMAKCTQSPVTAPLPVSSAFMLTS